MRPSLSTVSWGGGVKHAHPKKQTRWQIDIERDIDGKTIAKRRTMARSRWQNDIERDIQREIERLYEQRHTLTTTATDLDRDVDDELAKQGLCSSIV